MDAKLTAEEIEWLSALDTDAPQKPDLPNRKLFPLQSVQFDKCTPEELVHTFPIAKIDADSDASPVRHLGDSSVDPGPVAQDLGSQVPRAQGRKLSRHL